MKRKRKPDHFITNAPKDAEFTIRTDVGSIVKDEFYPGGSVAEHKQLESANELIGSDEVKQQNENL